MRYLGGKKLIADELANIIHPYIKDDYFEPFCGGLWVSVAIAKKCKSSVTFYLSDIHADLILLYNDLYRNKICLPEHVTEDEYKEYKSKKPSALRGFIGFACSFGGKWFGGYARGENRNYCKETKNRLEKTFSILRQYRVFFTCMSYEELEPEDSTIYCDPPYKDTTTYTTGTFDHLLYYQKIKQLSITNNVFCSEYNMPIGTILWEKEKHMSVNKEHTNTYRIERLYKIDPTE